jgi:hypothetical protein
MRGEREIGEKRIMHVRNKRNGARNNISSPGGILGVTLWGDKNTEIHLGRRRT